MRVTNGMIRNTTLNGLYNNMNVLNKTFAQMATGKKIQTVSDDPIIAGRALKLKATVLENSQYESNVKEAMSWMEVTESSLDNMTEILKTIRTKFVQAATGTLEKADKEAIKTDTAQLWKQLKEEVNATYGGRYIFSGYKTNEPLVLTQDYKVEDSSLKVQDSIIVGSSTQVAAGSTLAAGSQLSEGSVLGKGTRVEGDFTLAAGTVLSKEDTQELLGITLEGGKYFFDKPRTLEKGTELTKEQVLALKNDLGIDVGMPATHTEDTFILENSFQIGEDKDKGLSNNIAKQLFGVEGSADSYTLTTECSKAGYEFKGDVKVGAGSTFTGKITTQGTTTLNESSVINKDSELLVGSVIGKGTLNPKVAGKIDNHSMQYEIGVNSTIGVNVEGMDKIFSQMAECFDEVFLTVEASLNDDSITESDLHEMFTKKLDEIDDIMKQVSEKTSDLGSRMSRLDYTKNRLTDQKTTFKNLLSETEDIDIEEVYTNFNVQYATYQSALQATSKIITNTLADYL